MSIDSRGQTFRHAIIATLQSRICVVQDKKNIEQGNATDLRHLRKPVELRMLLRPILLHVVRYSEYTSDRDTEPSGFASKCAFSLVKDEKGD